MPDSLKDWNHAFLFFIFITMGVLGARAFLKYSFKRLNWSGPAAFVA